MKKLAYFILFCVAVAVQPLSAQTAEIEWLSLEEAVKKSKEEPRQILVDVYTPWCGPCKKMEAVTFKDPAVVDYVNKHFYAVKFNAEGGKTVNFKGRDWVNERFDPNKSPRMRNAPHPLASYWGVRSYPTLLLLDEKTRYLDSYIGYKDAPRLMPILQNARKAKVGGRT